MNRLKGTLYDGTTRLRRSDGTPIAMYSMAGLAEYAVVPATDVFPLPDGLPLEESSVLGCAVFTAYGAVRHGADLRGGERIAVVAAGGVGLNIIQIAKAFGASQIIAVDVRDDKLEAADAARRHRRRQLDDDRCGDARPRADRRPRRRRRRSKCSAAARRSRRRSRCIRDGGRMVAVGIAPGKTAAPVEITRLVRRGLRIIGSYGARTRSRHAGDHPPGRAGHLPPRDDRHAAVPARPRPMRRIRRSPAAKSSGERSSITVTKASASQASRNAALES